MYLSISVFLHLLIYDAVLFSMHVYMLILAAAKMDIFRVHTQKCGHKAMRNDRPRMHKHFDEYEIARAQSVY